MTTPFQGVKHGEIARLVHSKPEQWYSLIFGQPIGKPIEEEAMCQQILIHLGYSLLEIKDLHECNFDIQKYMDSQTSDTAQKASAARSTALPSTNSRSPISISGGSLLSHSATSLLSYVPTSPLDSIHIDNVQKGLIQSDSEAQRLKLAEAEPSTSTSTQQPPVQAKGPSTSQSVVDESANKQSSPKLDDCGGIFDLEWDD